MPQITEMSPETVNELLAAGDIMLVDVREPHEFSEARIAGAFNFPLSSFKPESLPTGGRQIVLHCGTGKRSGIALEACAAAGVDVTAHMKGGLVAWRQAGLTAIAVDPSTGKLVAR